MGLVMSAQASPRDWNPAFPWVMAARVLSKSGGELAIGRAGHRGLRGVKLVISDAHEGLKAAIARVLHATWQRCRVHLMRNLLAHAGRQGRGLALLWWFGWP